MSSQLTSLVPVLENTGNYQAWSSAMQSYLMSQGIWCVMTQANPMDERTTKTTVSAGPSTEKAKGTVEGDEEDAPPSITTVGGSKSLEDKAEEWEDKNSRALGCLRLRLDASIAYKYRQVAVAGALWIKLQQEYGAPGISAIYIEFKKILNLSIPENEDPSIALDQIQQHFGRMAEANAPVPDYLQAMMIIAKLPPSDRKSVV